MPSWLRKALYVLGGLVGGLIFWVGMIVFTGSACALPGMTWGCNDALAIGGVAQKSLSLWDKLLLVALPLIGAGAGLSTADDHED